jgi:transcriptional regulator with XRE-family HTH domain
MGQRVTQKSKDEFAKLVKEWRERKGLSQSEAAEELGLPSKRTLLLRADPKPPEGESLTIPC